MPFHCVRCHAEIDRNFKACPHCGEPITDFLRRYLEEPVDGKYRILERLGAGGMGEVYKVEHVYLRATRVIKVIRAQISESTDAHDRFLREAQLATKVQHPNVATLHDFSALPDGSHYMVWEFIEGENLAQVLRVRGPLAPAEALGLAVQALSGLDAIHRAGIVHRDISPENLMLTPAGQIKIIDLGVAKSDDGDYAATQTGIFVGKLRYASPEHLGFIPEGEKIDGRADLYSMALVLVEMLTGKPPFEATSPHQYILHYSDQNVQPPDLSNVPGGPELRAALRRALERDRNKRFASAREFAEVLEPIAATAKTVSDDETMRLTPPSGTTVRTKIAEAPPPPAPPTVVEPQRSRSSATTLIVVLAVLFVGFAGIVGGGLVAWRMWSRHIHPAASAVVTNTIAPAPPSPATTATQAPAPQVSEAEVTVTTAPAPAPASEPRVVEKPKTREVVEKETPPATTTVAPEKPAADVEPPHSFKEGGMSSRNDEAVSFAHDRLRGVTSVALDARGDADLVKQLGQILQKMGLALSDDAPVRIRFYGTVTHQGFGRKIRAAEATVLKNGHPILEYQMKPEEYHVGDNPAEAFARVLNDVFGR